MNLGKLTATLLCRSKIKAKTAQKCSLQKIFLAAINSSSQIRQQLGNNFLSKIDIQNVKAEVEAKKWSHKALKDVDLV